MSTAADRAGPYAHARGGLRGVMGAVVIALLPVTALALYRFGWPAIALFAVTLIAALATEAVCRLAGGRPLALRHWDGSALVTGWLLALSLPPWAPWWIGVLGSLIAIGIAKEAFGGTGQNLFNPAMVGRTALLVSFPLEMTRFVPPMPLGSAEAPGLTEGLAITFGGAAPSLDGLTQATPLSALGDSAEAEPLASALGDTAGSLGETGALLIAVGGLFLIARGVIAWHIPAAMLGTLAGLAALFHGIDPEAFAGPTFHLLTGSVMLGAFFIATDLVTSPMTVRGQWLFGVGCGLLVYVIRTWGNYPEGVAFAVLLMNAATPVIDHWIRPRVFGRDRRGRPLEP